MLWNGRKGWKGRWLWVLALVAVALCPLIAAQKIGDPYKILGIHRRATLFEIRKAYRQLAKEWYVFVFRKNKYWSINSCVLLFSFFSLKVSWTGWIDTRPICREMLVLFNKKSKDNVIWFSKIINHWWQPKKIVSDNLLNGWMMLKATHYNNCNVKHKD